ncbi:MAG: S-layer homology domain-containing protein [Prolixibacteraceae bacterium]|nr:S-layer homology domain-containing protein [Prolixibacteraceae bacterium]
MVNSANYTDASLSAEDYEPSTYTLAFWASDAARTLEIGSGDGSNIGDLTSGGNSEIYAHVALSSFYFDVPGLGSFTDNDESKNIIAGELSWTIPVDTSGITGYKVYWGNNSKEKLSADALYTVIGADNCYQEVPDGTPLPDGAEYFLIYSYGATGESYDFLAIPIVDNIVYAQTPGINTQPTGVTVSIGETATFTIIASAPDGGSLSYQWQIKSGSKWIDLSEAATSSSYTTPVATYTDNGTQYRCVVTNSKNGTTATVNSNAATLTVNPDTITAASVTGIVAPSAGESPITVGNLTAGNESYTVVTRLTWENSDGTPATLTAEGKFKAAWTYQAEIEMTAAEGYKFQALTPTVNTGTAASGTLDGEGSMLTFIITFAPTEALAATGISVNIQPAKLIYAEGEALDISGLRVTLAYKDGSTANIGHEQLAANNITVNPENGTIMSAEEHNGQTITLTCNSHTATTDSLTVYTYTINLSETDTFTFTPQRAGYSSVTPLTVTVTRTGTGVITNLAAALSGINSDAFILGELDTTTLDNTVTSAAFTVKPNDGLAAGNYSAVVTVTSDHSVKKEFEIRFTVNRQSASSVTNTSVKDGFDILINGKAVTSATATTILEGNKTVTSVVVDDKKVEEKLEHEGKNSVVTIPVINGSDTVIGALKGQTLKIMENMEAVFEIKTENVSYIIPASQLNIDGFLARLGEQIESKDVDVCVKISEPDSDSVKIVEDTASKNNYQIIVKPIKFEITCTNGDKTVEVSKFNAYVERLIAIPEGVNPSKITTGVVVNPDGTFSHVPTVITMIDGKYYAKINSLTNSMYSVIYSHRTFNDVENHWAQKDILDMASRLIISGAGNDLFEPERSITRAEFAAVMVRALGLGPEEYKNDFSDVKSGDWYSGYISTASYYGLIKGYDDGTFKPDKTVSRQEAMAILVRAMDITKLGEERETGTNTILSTFDDNTDVSDWAKDPIAKCLITGVVTGRNNGCIAPLDGIKRAEAAIMVRRLLINSNLIN